MNMGDWRVLCNIVESGFPDSISLSHFFGFSFWSLALRLRSGQAWEVRLFYIAWERCRVLWPFFFVGVALCAFGAGTVRTNTVLRIFECRCGRGVGRPKRAMCHNLYGQQGIVRDGWARNKTRNRGFLAVTERSRSTATNWVLFCSWLYIVF